MWPNPQIPADLVTFTKEILSRKKHFLCSVEDINNKYENHTSSGGSRGKNHLVEVDYLLFFL